MGNDKIIDLHARFDREIQAEALCAPPWELPPVEAYADEPSARKVNGHAAAPPVAKHNDVPKLILRPIHEIVAEQRETVWLLHRVLEAGVLAVIAGARSTFKSFIALDWAMRMVVDGHPGVILSGEGGGLGRRVAAWMQQHGQDVDLRALPLVALERPVNLNVGMGLIALEAAMSGLPKPPAFTMIDTLSKFSTGLDENDNSEVATFLSSLSSGVRDAFDCSVLLVAHSGHSDAKRPRGASALMANPDVEYIVERPSMLAMTVTVSRERFKDAPSMPPLGYEARVIDLGRCDRYGDPVTSLALVSSDASLTKPTQQAKQAAGRNQLKATVALKEWARANPDAMVISSPDMRGLLKAQGLSDKRRPEVLTYMVGIRAITPSVGGYSIDREML